MRILVTNDDGYNSIGIRHLYDAFKEGYEAFLCAPLTQKSAFGHAINYADYLELKTLKAPVKGYAFDSTPADCARIALNGLFSERFDLVVSGINYGVNVAQDIFYSGTVGAAREASFNDLMAVAFSLDLQEPDSRAEKLFAYSAKIARKIIDSLHQEIIDYRGSIININFPQTMPAKGIKLTDIGSHHFKTSLKRTERDGKDFVWIYTEDVQLASDKGTDVYELRDGWITVTALRKGVVLDPKLQSMLSYLEKLSVD